MYWIRESQLKIYADKANKSIDDYVQKYGFMEIENCPFSNGERIFTRHFLLE